MSESGEPVLTPPAREAIRAYLLKVISVPAVLLTIGSFFVGFFVHELASQKAYNEAYSKANASAIQELVGLARTTTEAAETAKAAKRQLDALLVDVKGVESVAAALRDTAKVVEDTSARLAKDSTFVSSVIAKIGSAGATTTVGYGPGVHVNKPLASKCPPGYYVTGVEVAYGGTCDRKCDLDGGVVKEVRLVCQSFGAK